MVSIPVPVQIVLMPVITLLIWYLMFNSNNEWLTKFFVEGGYMLMVIPIIILTFLSIPMMVLIFWARSVELGREVTLALGAVMLMLTIISEYYWIKRQINAIEERENMSFWEYLKRETSKETRQKRKIERKANKEEASAYFDEISELNRKRRELDREEKEKLRRALLGDIDAEAE